MSYERSYLNVADRRPVCAVMMFRQQSETGPGQPRTIEVRYPGTAQDGPFETHDMTDMVTDINHASIVARYILAKKRYLTHTVSCSIGRRGRSLIPGEIVQIDLALQTTDGEGVTDSLLYEIEEIREGVDGQVLLELLEFPVDDDGISLIAKGIENGTVVATSTFPAIRPAGRSPRRALCRSGFVAVSGKETRVIRGDRRQTTGYR